MLYDDLVPKGEVVIKHYGVPGMRWKNHVYRRQNSYASTHKKPGKDNDYDWNPEANKKPNGGRPEPPRYTRSEDSYASTHKKPGKDNDYSSNPQKPGGGGDGAKKPHTNQKSNKTVQRHRTTRVKDIRKKVK